MTTAELLNAYAAHTAAVAAYETANPFDLATAMGRPAAPHQSVAAQTGEMIATRGLTKALAVALTHAMDGTQVSAQLRAVYTELVLAAVDAA